MPVWVSAGGNKEGYHATYNKYGHNITINFALSHDEVAEAPLYYFDMVFIDRSSSISEDSVKLGLSYELEETQQNYDLFIEYLNTLRNDG
jgi:hypothetical protein